jgi:tetratricopeptide (TPR) repeat protein
MRVRRCGPEVEELLRAAVVAGSPFEVGHVADLLGVSSENVAQHAEIARRARLLRASGPDYEFANDLIREAMYLTTPESLRRLRHRRLATLLTDRPEAAAEHAWAAGDWHTAVTRWVEAAARAAKVFSNREADQLLTRALTACALFDDPGLSAGVQLARGRARLALGHYAAASEDLNAALQLARAIGSQSTEAAALTELGWSAYHARDLRRAHELAERAAAHPDAGPRAKILVGRVRNVDGDLEGAMAVLEPVSANEPDPAARALALSCLGTALAHSDRYHDSVRVLEDAVVACSRSGVLRGLLNARVFGAMSHANLGHFGAALTWIDDLLSDVERYGAAFYHARALNTQAWVWRELGHAGRAHDLAEEALERSVKDDGEMESEPAAHALLALAESALIDGNHADAMRRLGEIAPLVSDRVGFMWRLELRRLELVARMEPERAEELLYLARRHGSWKYEALALSSLGRLDEASAAARRTGSAWMLARVAPEPLARASAAEIARALPAALREGFITNGLVNQRWTAPS